MKYPQKHMMEAIRQITKIGTVIAVTAFVLGRIQHNTISAMLPKNIRRLITKKQQPSIQLMIISGVSLLLGLMMLLFWFRASVFITGSSILTWFEFIWYYYIYILLYKKLDRRAKKQLFYCIKNILLIDLGEIIIPNKGSESNLLGVWRILEEKKMSYLISQT